MARSAGRSWWATKVRQFRDHVLARVRPEERTALAAWTTEEELHVFDAMHVADRRHGLDVVAALRARGVGERDVLVAGLIHDAGKGNTGVLARIAWSLGQAYGSWVWRLAGTVPGLGASLRRLREHPELSAGIAERAGCSPRTIGLIRHQDDPRDPEYGELLRQADEAS